MMVDATIWQQKAALWELCAFSFRYPTLELAQAVATGEWSAAANELDAALQLGLPEGIADEAGAAYAGLELDEATCKKALNELRVEATKLFVGAPCPQVFPYEGMVRVIDEGDDPLLFVNPYAMEVDKFCENCGLGHPDNTNEPLDHIATECELMQHLASVEAGIVAEGGCPCSQPAYPGGSAASAYAEFLEKHLLPWAPAFAQEAEQAATLPFFKAAAVLLGKAIAHA